jgi:hypothetical protein
MLTSCFACATQMEEESEDGSQTSAALTVVLSALEGALVRTWAGGVAVQAEIAAVVKLCGCSEALTLLVLGGFAGGAGGGGHRGPHARAVLVPPPARPCADAAGCLGSAVVAARVPVLEAAFAGGVCRSAVGGCKGGGERSS